MFSAIMTTTTETPDQLLERLEQMGLGRARSLLVMNHFEGKAQNLVKGWIARKEEEEELKVPPSPTPPAAAAPDAAAVQETIRMSRRAIREAQATREVVAQMRRLNTIAIATATAAIVVSILSLFALALR